MKRIIWRNRASALLGICVVLIAILNGPPAWLRTATLVILGLLIAIFGFARAHNSGADSDLMAGK